MDKLYQKYVGFLYVKNFLIIFLALEFFYVGVDLLSNLKDLPTSANLQLLYVYYNAQLAMNYTLPLSLVFAMISSKISMIRSNELVSLYASGISRSQVITPLFITSMFLTFILIGLNFTSFAYSVEYKSNILKYNRISNDSSRLFVKYDDKYIYFNSLNPVKKTATDVKIFDTNKTSLKRIISSKKAVFTNGAWFFKEANVTTLPKDKRLGKEGFSIKPLKNITLLRGFKPTIIDTLHDGKASLSVVDAYDAMRFLGSQGADVSWAKSALYSFIFFPLFAPFMVVILFFYMPPTGRFFNMALLGFLFIFITLCVWGVIFVLSKFSANSIILPELAVILPIVFMGFYALKLFYKNA